MLSTKVVGTVVQAVVYYKGSDNYYTEDGKEAVEKSIWWGKGAEKLGIDGKHVETEVFENLLNGQLPSGQQLGVKLASGEIKHRSGFDLTFSVPKTLSLLTLTTTDEDIKEKLNNIILNAAKKTLGLVEQSCSQARVTSAGNTYFVNTGNLTVAMFLHDISREGEPNIHVHAVVMNMTETKEGKWRSLASKLGYYGANANNEINGFIERVRHHKHYFGAIFRSELAYDLKAENVPIVVTDKKNAYFEIDGISEESKQAYSTRAKQIAHYMKEHGFSGAKAAAVATIKTRALKSSINRETLDELWKHKGKEAGVDVFKESEEVVARIKNTDPEAASLNASEETMESVKYALEYLADSQNKIRQIQLINYTIQNGIGKNINLENIIKSIDLLKASGELIPIETRGGEVYYTTEKLLNYEQSAIASIELKLPTSSTLPADKIETYLAKDNQLTIDSQKAIKHILGNDAQVVILDGDANTNKSDLIKPMIELAKNAGFDSVVLTPSKSASQALRAQIKGKPESALDFFKHLFDGNQYTSVQGFINQQKKYIESGKERHFKRVIFVENSQILGAKQLCDLNFIADKLKTKLVLLGDKKSDLGWNKGSPYTQLLENGVISYTLSDKAIRTQSMHQAAEVIKDTLDNNISAAFSKIGNKILSVKDDEERTQQIAEHYVNLSKEDQKNAIILAQNKSKSNELNLSVHNKLKETGGIDAQAFYIETLQPRFMKKVEYERAFNYKSGEWVRFNDAYTSLKIDRGDYFKISGINKRNNIVILEDMSGNKRLWNPLKAAGKSGKVEVFTEKTIEIARGERIAWRRNYYHKDINSGEVLEVSSVNNHKITLVRENNKKVSVNLKSFQAKHFDYAYSTTTSNDKKYDIILAEKDSKYWGSTQRQFYKTLAQSKKSVWIYTDDKNDLLNQIKARTGDKTTIIDTLLKDSKPAYIPNSSAYEHITLLENAVLTAINKLKSNTPTSKQTPEAIAQDAVKYALLHLTEREAAFQHKDVLETALKHALGNTKHEHIQNAVIEAEKSGELVRGLFSQDGTRWTTRGAIDMEREIISLAKTGMNTLKPLMNKSSVESYLSSLSPKEDHRTAITEWMTSKDQILLVEGRAGTGKTTMLKIAEPLLKTLKDQEYELLCLAPTHKAVKELRDRGLKAKTLDSFLGEQRKLHSKGVEAIPKHNHKLILALDEDSMTSNRRSRDILRYSKDIEARIVAIGDVRQYGAIESGKPRELLINSGIKTIKLDQIIRQKNKDLLEAVTQTYEKDFKKAFDTLSDRIIEIGEEAVDEKVLDNKAIRLEEMSNKYTSMKPAERAKIGMITLGNEERTILNTLVIEALREKGELTGKPFKTTIYVPKDMSAVELTKAGNFTKDDWIRFGYSDKYLGIQKNDYFKVGRVHTKENLLTLIRPDNTQVIWQPKQFDEEQRTGIEVYSKEQRSAMSGMLIRWTRTDKELGLISPEFAIINKIEGSTAIVDHVNVTENAIEKTGKSEKIELSQDKFKHWDHAYSLTNYSVQGGSYNGAMANIESYSRHLTNQKSFLIALSRAINDFTLFTDNKANLLKKLIETTGEKTSALETIGEVKFSNISHLNGKKIKSSQPQQSVSERYFSKDQVDQIISRLHQNSENIVQRILGHPRKINGDDYQYSYSEQFGGEDTKREGGSLFVAINGDKQGLWHSFKTGESGNLLHLIQKKYQLDFTHSMQYAMQLLGITKEQVSNKVTTPKIQRRPVEIDKSDPKNWTETQKKRVELAIKIANESRPIKGTLAEKYLREARSINLDNILSDLKSLRFHPAIYSKINQKISPALVAIATNKSGKVQAVQAIFLDETTGQKADSKVVKQTWGVVHGASVKLNENAPESNKRLFIEGPEDSVSVLASTKKYPIEVTLSQSNFVNAIKHSDAKEKIACLDNDGGIETVKQSKFTEKFVEKTQELDNVKVVIPNNREGRNKTDYNDTYKELGADEIVNIIEKPVALKEFSSSKTINSQLENKPLNHKENKPIIEHIDILDQLNSTDKTYQEVGNKLLNNDKYLSKAIEQYTQDISKNTDHEMLQAYTNYESIVKKDMDSLGQERPDKQKDREQDI